MPKVGSYRGNDLFHCIIHLLDYASLDQEADISEVFLREFADYYGMNDLTLDEVATLLDEFPHPFDREILLGEVFKNVFSKDFPGVKSVEIDSVALLLFLNRIGGNWEYKKGEFIESKSNMKIIYTRNRSFFGVTRGSILPSHRP